MASQGSVLTPEQWAERLCPIANDRLALRCSDGSIIDPLIGEPSATLVRYTVMIAITQAVAAERNASGAPMLAEALEALANAAESYMRYHAEKFYAESDCLPTGLWPHIQAARAALKLFAPPEPEGRSNLNLFPGAAPSAGDEAPR